jgi:hypothetical protein
LDAEITNYNGEKKREMSSLITKKRYGKIGKTASKHELNLK